jgi:hypothetical protein
MHNQVIIFSGDKVTIYLSYLKIHLHKKGYRLFTGSPVFIQTIQKQLSFFVKKYLSGCFFFLLICINFENRIQRAEVDKAGYCQNQSTNKCYNAPGIRQNIKIVQQNQDYCQ